MSSCISDGEEECTYRTSALACVYETVLGNRLPIVIMPRSEIRVLVGVNVSTRTKVSVKRAQSVDRVLLTD